jgi:hypothetical protein
MGVNASIRQGRLPDRRTSASGDFCSKKARTVLRHSSCSAVRVRPEVLSDCPREVARVIAAAPSRANSRDGRDHFFQRSGYEQRLDLGG